MRVPHARPVPGRRPRDIQSRGRRDRVLTACAMAACLVLTGGCTVPRAKEAAGGKRAVTEADAAAVVAYISRLHDEAVAGKGNELAAVESAEVVDIDSTNSVVRARLRLPSDTWSLQAPTHVLAGRFDSYPLWFAAVAPVGQTGEQLVGVFRRAHSTSPWVLTAAPRLAADTQIPAAAQSADGSAVVYDAGIDRNRWSDGEPVEPVTPDRLARRYASVLESPRSPYADDFVDDSFRTQMRRLAAAQPAGGVVFTQSWRPAPVRYGIRLTDGGALLFATLERVERFRVYGDARLSFAGLEAGAYLRTPIARSATVRYLHQVLLLAPARGRPLVVGQYGGLVAARGR